MSMNVFGLFLFGLFSFLMGKDHNPNNSYLSKKDFTDAMFTTWALIGFFSFLFGWFDFGVQA